MFERFTADARTTVVRAQVHAARRRDSTIAPTHLLLALTEGRLGGLLEGYNVTAETVERDAPAGTSHSIDDDVALRSIGIDLYAIRASIESAFGPGALETPRGPSRRFAPWARRGNRRHRAVADNAKKALELSLRETIRLDAREIGAESLLLGLLRTGDPELTRVFEHAGVNQANLRTDLETRIRHAA